MGRSGKLKPSILRLYQSLILQGPKCLSRSKEYQQLNNLASIFAMKKLHKELDNLEKHRAEDLAEDLFKAAIDGPTRDQILQSGVDVSSEIIFEPCVLTTTSDWQNHQQGLLYSECSGP